MRGPNHVKSYLPKLKHILSQIPINMTFEFYIFLFINTH